jgi:hypothetical protein
VSGNTECTPLGSTPVLHQREEKYLSVAALRLLYGSILITYLALSTARTILPFKVVIAVKLIS